MTDLSLIEELEGRVCKVLGSPDHAASVMLSGQDWSTILQGLRAIGERDRLREALERIANGHGHCGMCGTPCGFYTECECELPPWVADDPAAVARTALKEPGHEG